jgi:predicted acyltransferase
VFGKNPLFIYVVSELLIVIFSLIPLGQNGNVAETSADGIMKVLPGAFGSLLFAVIYMLICWSVGKFLDKKKIYIRV